MALSGKQRRVDWLDDADEVDSLGEGGGAWGVPAAVF